MKKRPEYLTKLVKRLSIHHVTDTTCTIAVLVLHTGFVVIGKSACTSSENFNQDIGNEMALDDAFRKLAEHEAYLATSDRHELEQNTVTFPPFPRVEFRDPFAAGPHPAAHYWLVN